MPIDTVENILAVIGPQFVTDPRLADFIGLARLETSVNFGEKYNFAVALRVCHELALEAMQGGDGGTSTAGSGVSGQITSEKEGDLARSYGKAGSGSDADSALSTTKYGSKLLELRSGHFFFARTSLIDEGGNADF